MEGGAGFGGPGSKKPVGGSWTLVSREPWNLSEERV